MSLQVWVNVREGSDDSYAFCVFVLASLDMHVIDSSIGLEHYQDPIRWRWRLEDDLR